MKLDEEVVDPDDVEMLEDLIVAAVNEAMGKVDELSLRQCLNSQAEWAAECRDYFSLGVDRNGLLQ